MKRFFGLACVAALALPLASCSRSEDLGIGAAAHDGEPFTIAEAVGDGVERAYVFCPYTDKSTGAELGFDPDDFFAIDDNSYAWETYTGIGVIFDDGREPAVEWFDPTDIDACSEYSGPLDIHTPITPVAEQRQFTDDNTAEVITLQVAAQ